MSERDDGGQELAAKHIRSAHGEPMFGYFRDMSLRDWFAGQACCGLMADAITFGDVKRPAKEALAEFAHCAYAVADAMLAERAKPST